MQRAYNLGRKVWVISKIRRDGDRLLQLLIFNEECLVSASHQLALITSLPFVHTARRSYRLNGPVKRLDYGFLMVRRWITVGSSLNLII